MRSYEDSTQKTSQAWNRTHNLLTEMLHCQPQCHIDAERILLNKVQSSQNAWALGTGADVMCDQGEAATTDKEGIKISGESGRCAAWPKQHFSTYVLSAIFSFHKWNKCCSVAAFSVAVG